MSPHRRPPARVCWRNKTAKKGIRMSAIVLEHVPMAELPQAWRAALAGTQR
jgi:hypothetical protein